MDRIDPPAEDDYTAPPPFVPFDFSGTAGRMQCSDAACQRRDPVMRVGHWSEGGGNHAYYCGSCGSVYFLELIMAEERDQLHQAAYLKIGRYAHAHNGKFVPVEGSDGAPVADPTHPMDDAEVRKKHGNLRIVRLSQFELDSDLVSAPRIQACPSTKSWKILHNDRQIFNYQLFCDNNQVLVR